MKEDVVEYIRSCPVCQLAKPTPKPPIAVKPLPAANRPFESITLDWLSGFPMNKHGHNCVLNIVDRFSKWTIVIPCTKTMNTEELCDVLFQKVFSWIGLPLSILGDRDTRLTAKQMRRALDSG